MVFLARLGAIEALIGFALGLWLWRTLDRSNRHLVAFLGLSGLLGVLAAGLRIAGKTNAWVGDIWELVILVTLFQALLLRSSIRIRNVAKLSQLFLVASWVAYFIFAGKFGEFSSGFHVAVCIVGLGIAACAVISNPGAAFLACIVMTALFVDILPHAASQNWLNIHHFAPRSLWVFRNSIWCLAYIGMAASLGLKESNAD